MLKRTSLLALLAVCTLAGSVRAQALSPDEKAFFDKHLAEVVTVTPKRLTDAAVIKVFATPIYEIAVTVKDGDGGTSDQKQLAARVDDKLVGVTRPGSDGDYPAIQKMFSPSFTLLTDDDAKTLQAALDLLRSGRVSPDFMVTHRFGFADTKRAFDLVHEYRDGVIKAVIGF